MLKSVWACAIKLQHEQSDFGMQPPKSQVLEQVQEQSPLRWPPFWQIESQQEHQSGSTTPSHEGTG
jgi:hypothetical protein